VENQKHIKDEELPLVSVITPLYNASSFISETISSLQKQSHTRWEHLIVDDCSSDNSVKIVEELALDDSRIELFKTSENKGAASCRNYAINQANGEFIAFLDSDDLWHPEKLEKQISFMRRHSCHVSYTSYLHINEMGKPIGKRIVALPSLSYKKEKKNNYIGNLTGVYNAAVLGKILAPNLRKRQDWALWLEAIKRSGKPAKGLQEDLAYYRIREGSISSNKFNLIQYNFAFYRKYLGYSWLVSSLYLLRFLWEYFIVRPKQIETY
jgi:teichuronic acid biosynthesis glycosyltransferase TuaG